MPFPLENRHHDIAIFFVGGFPSEDAAFGLRFFPLVSKKWAGNIGMGFERSWVSGFKFHVGNAVGSRMQDIVNEVKSLRVVGHAHGVLVPRRQDFRHAVHQHLITTGVIDNVPLNNHIAERSACPKSNLSVHWKHIRWPCCVGR